MKRNYILGSLLLTVGVILTVIFALLISFHIMHYQQAVSFYFSWQFFTYDLFATELMGLILLATIINFASGSLLFSGLLKPHRSSDIIILAFASILWVVLFLSLAFSAEYQFLLMTPLAALGLLMMTYRHVTNIGLFIFMGVITGAIAILGFA